MEFERAQNKSTNPIEYTRRQSKMTWPNHPKKQTNLSGSLSLQHQHLTKPSTHTHKKKILYTRGLQTASTLGTLHRHEPTTRIAHHINLPTQHSSPLIQADEHPIASNIIYLKGNLSHAHCTYRNYKETTKLDRGHSQAPCRLEPPASRPIQISDLQHQRKKKQNKIKSTEQKKNTARPSAGGEAATTRTSYDEMSRGELLHRERGGARRDRRRRRRRREPQRRERGV